MKACREDVFEIDGRAWRLSAMLTNSSKPQGPHYWSNGLLSPAFGLDFPLSTLRHQNHDLSGVPSSTSSISNSSCLPLTRLHHSAQLSLRLTQISPLPSSYTTYPPFFPLTPDLIHLYNIKRYLSTRTPNKVQKIVTMDVRNVIVLTWQPKKDVRSSKRSGPRAQINLYRMGESNGNALERGSRGRGRHV